MDMGALTSISGSFNNLMSSVSSMGAQTSAETEQWMQSQVSGESSPGVGLGASGIPAPPIQAYTDLQQLQQQHQTNQQNYMTQMGTLVTEQKDQFFESNHYVTDANGQIQMGSNGLPLMSAGPETAQENMARVQWEQTQQQQVQQQNQAETASFNNQVNAFMQAANNPAVLQSPGGMQALSNEETQLQTEQTNMTVRQQFEQMAAGAWNVPGISDMITQGAQKYTNLVQADQANEQASPAGQAINNYQKDMLEFMISQQQMMKQMAAAGLQAMGALGSTGAGL